MELVSLLGKAGLVWRAYGPGGRECLGRREPGTCLTSGQLWQKAVMRCRAVVVAHGKGAAGGAEGEETEAAGAVSSGQAPEQLLQACQCSRVRPVTPL